MSDVLYSRLGIVIHQMAQDLMSRKTGDRIPSISEYQEQFQVARGTVQNALSYLKDGKAVQLRNRGTLGTYIESLDYHKLQNACIIKSILGAMPLPYSTGYQGMATAFYESLSELDCNLVYVRGAETRIHMVEQGVYQFAICSQAAAERMISDGASIKVILNFGKQSYLTKHVLVLRDKNAVEVENGMRIAYDRGSLDQRLLVDLLVKKKEVKYVDIRYHQTIAAIEAGKIDAGVWNYDEILENQHKDLHIADIEGGRETDKFNSAVMVIRKEEEAVEQILTKYITVSKIRKIQALVKSGKIISNY